MSRPRVVVIQNGPGGGPRRLGEWLAEDGLDLEVRHGYDGDEIPQSADGYDAVVVLGGGYMPDDISGAPWLAPTRTLMTSALDDDLPVLGICLGGQMLAQLAGGEVRADAGAPEIGSTAIRLRPEAAGDPLFGELGDQVTAIERHVDVIDALPPRAVYLAESDLWPQAFRVGDHAWGVQFHPEAGADDVDGWSDEDFTRHGLDPHEVKRRTRENEPESAARWRTMATGFARVVTDAAAT